MWKIYRDERGVTATELAIIMPVFLLLLAGMIEFGMAYWQQHVLTSAAREGARAASLYRSTANEDTIRNMVTQYIRDGGVSTTGVTVNITQEGIPGDTGSMKVVTVSKPYSFKFISVIISSFNYLMGNGTFPENITINGEAKMVIEEV